MQKFMAMKKKKAEFVSQLETKMRQSYKERTGQEATHFFTM